MRILAVTPYYTPEGGGLERYAHAILSRLAARGHQVEVVTCTRQHDRDEWLDEVLVHRERAPFRMGNTPIDPRFGRRVSRRIRSFAPDVVLAHTPVPFPAEMAFRAARRRQVPFVTTYHAGRLRGSSPVLELIARFDERTLQRQMLEGSAALIAVTPFVRDHALLHHKDKVRIVPPGVDGTLFQPAVAEDGTVLFVGPLSSSYRWKGLDVLWEAFLIVRKSRPDARLLLVGEGDRFDEFQKKAEDLGGSVVLLGRQDERGLVAAYQRASVLVLPSTTDAESFGMVLAEANACGRPVVASRVGGVPCFVRDGDNGLLARPGDAGDLAAKIRSLLDDTEHADRLGRAGRQRVLEEHDWDRLAVQTEAVLEEALAPAGPAGIAAERAGADVRVDRTVDRDVAGLTTQKRARS